MPDLFFPPLTRRKAYQGNGSTSKYTDYHAEIEEDCKQRCVYCDAALTEIGFEGMQLDHFRPQKHFPALVHEPTNLVLGCAKCNRSKWYHWPSDKTPDAPCYNGNVGFIDPFRENRSDFFSVKENGEIECLKVPANYIVKLLNLNRKARLQVRRMRLIRHEVMELTHQYTDRIHALVESWRSGRSSASAAMEEIERLEAAIGRLLALQKLALKP